MNGWKIHCRRSRESLPGIPVVYVHGLVISSLYFVPLAECMASSATVYVPDQPGFGLSEGPRRALNIPEIARALIDWMNIAEIPECHVVANSLGCQIATAMAVLAPERFRTLTLIGPTVDPRIANLRSQAARIIWDAPHEPMQLWMNHALDQWRAGCRRIWATIFHMLGDRIEERLPYINQPTCVLRGRHDPTASEEWVQHVARLLPRGHARTLPGWHCVHYSHPAQTAEVIREFIATSTRAEVKA